MSESTVRGGLHTPIGMPRAEIETAVGILTRAFDRDPLWTALLPDDVKRARAFRRLWRSVIGYSIAYGMVTTTATRAGIACFLPPGRTQVTGWREARTGLQFARTLFSLSPASRRRFLRVLRRVDALHREAIVEPHGYVWALAVEPSRQRHGFGSSLLRNVLDGCDASQVPCYLETEVEENLRFYKRFGFEVVCEERLSVADVRMWALVRAAGPPPG